MKFSKKVVERIPSLVEGFEYLFNKGIEAVNKKEDQHRSKEYFHISSIGYCLKSLYLDHASGGKKEFDVSFLKKVGLGTCVHELYQKYLAHSGKLYGQWYCKRCGTTQAAGFEPGQQCCEKPKHSPSEFHLMNSKYKVSGHPDGLLAIHKPKLTLVEIKTISGFRKIGDGPQNVDKYVPEHKRQCNFYLHIMQDEATKIPGVDKDVLLAMLDTTRYLLVYLDKSTDATVPYEFAADTEQYKKDLARVQLFHKCVKDGIEPPAERSNTACKYCRWLNQCNGL